MYAVYAVFIVYVAHVENLNMTKLCLPFHFSSEKPGEVSNYVMMHQILMMFHHSSQKVSYKFFNLIAHYLNVVSVARLLPL